MKYYDKDGALLSYNDYVEVYTGDIGNYTGYIRSFQKNGQVKVNCMAADFQIAPAKIKLIAKIIS